MLEVDSKSRDKRANWRHGGMEAWRHLEKHITLAKTTLILHQIVSTFKSLFHFVLFTLPTINQFHLLILIQSHSLFSPLQPALKSALVVVFPIRNPPFNPAQAISPHSPPTPKPFYARDRFQLPSKSMDRRWCDYSENLRLYTKRRSLSSIDFKPGCLT